MSRFKPWTSLAVLLMGETGLGRLLRGLRARHGYRGAEADWNADYADGKWRFLHEIDQACHYELIALYRSRLKPGGSILDVGCGEGILHDTIGLAQGLRYVGIDPSETAIEIAETTATGNATFRVATAENFQTWEKFDVIVFNEVLYYCADPGAMISKYAGFLKPDGIFVVSMALCGIRDGLTKLDVWHEIERHARITTEVSLVGPAAGWVIKVLTPIVSPAAVVNLSERRKVAVVA